MPIRDFVRPLLKWWWLIIAATSLAIVTTYIAAQRQTLVYEARTTLAVGRTIFNLNPISGDLYLGQQLAGIYANLAQRGQIQKSTMDALGLDTLPEHIIHTLPNTQFIEIAVTDTYPDRAQIVANELAHQLILLGPTNPQQDDQERQLFVQEQLDYLEMKIEETQDEIEIKQTELAGITSARQIADTQETITALQDKLNDLQSNYVAFLADTQQDATNIISVIEPAIVPSEPVGPSTPLLVALSAIIGFTLGAGAAYLLEYLDDTLQTRDDVERVLDLPVLGYIPRTKRLASKGEEGILLFEEPNSAEAEYFRLLQTSLRFAWGEKTPKSILVTSLGPGDGKTTIAVNLAAAFAKSGKQVLLVDADLRRSKVHQFAKIPNELGLSEAFNENLDPAKMAHSVDDSRLKIVTSGSPVENPMEILDSIKLLKILANLEGEADLVIFDGAPLPLPDALVLASKLDGVLIVVRLGQVKETNASVILDQLKRAQANLLGVVLNRVPRGSGYNNIISLYGHKKIPHKRELSKDAVQEEAGDPAESELEETLPFKEETSKSKRSAASRTRKTASKEDE